MKNFSRVFLAAVLWILWILIGVPFSAHAFPGGSNEAFVEGNIMAGDTGKPIGGAKIFILGMKLTKKKGWKPNQGCGMGFALSAGNGNYAVGVGHTNLCIKKKMPFNGTYLVEVSKRGYLTQKKRVAFSLGTNVIGNLNFTLMPSHSYIHAHVTVGANSLPYAMVIIMKNPFSGIMKTMNMPSGQYTTKLKPSKRFGPEFTVHYANFFRTDKYGNATIPVSPGDYMVEASKNGYTLTTRNVNPLMQAWGAQMAQNPFMSPAMRQKMTDSFDKPEKGVFVHVVNGGTAVANLTLMPGSAIKSAPYIGGSPKKTFIPVEYSLDGQARFSPNNVLFFTLEETPPHDDAYLLDIVRSRVLLGSGKVDPFKAHIKTFNYAVYGWPSPIWCIHQGGISPSHCIPDRSISSFTDPTGKPGRVYYYYIFESSAPSFRGGKLNIFRSGTPYSNAVQIVTH